MWLEIEPRSSAETSHTLQRTREGDLGRGRVAGWTSLERVVAREDALVRHEAAQSAHAAAEVERRSSPLLILQGCRRHRRAAVTASLLILQGGRPRGGLSACKRAHMSYARLPAPRTPAYASSLRTEIRNRLPAHCGISVHLSVYLFPRPCASHERYRMTGRQQPLSPCGCCRPVGAVAGWERRRSREKGTYTQIAYWERPPAKCEKYPTDHVAPQCRPPILYRYTYSSS